MSEPTRNQPAALKRHEYDPPTDWKDERICQSCLKGYGSKSGHLPYTIANTRTGKYHASEGFGVTDCGIDATGEEFLWPM
jgi:hypothetical protein